MSRILPYFEPWKKEWVLLTYSIRIKGTMQRVFKENSLKPSSASLYVYNCVIAICMYRFLKTFSTIIISLSQTYKIQLFMIQMVSLKHELNIYDFSTDPYVIFLEINSWKIRVSVK